MPGSDDDTQCQFGIKRTFAIIKTFEEEIEGVRENTDIEYIHWMRVASRRLRAMLPLFADCVEREKYRRFTITIKTVTQALGAARDTDVQIAFLENFSRQEPGSRDMPGIMSLILMLKKQRQEEQAGVLAALDLLNKEDFIADLVSTLRQFKKKHAGTTPARRSRQLSRAAMKRIGKLLDDVLSYEPRLLDPEDIAGHHALRIAAKKLRYTLEVYRPLYKNRLRPFLTNLKKMQELLGEIHDCDIWAGILATKPDLSLLSGPDLTRLADDRKECRRVRYQELLFLWSVYKKKNIWNKLRKTITSGA